MLAHEYISTQVWQLSKELVKVGVKGASSTPLNETLPDCDFSYMGNSLALTEKGHQLFLAPKIDHAPYKVLIKTFER